MKGELLSKKKEKKTAITSDSPKFFQEKKLTDLDFTKRKMAAGGRKPLPSHVGPKIRHKKRQNGKDDDGKKERKRGKGRKSRNQRRKEKREAGEGGIGKKRKEEVRSALQWQNNLTYACWGLGPQTPGGFAASAKLDAPPPDPRWSSASDPGGFAARM